MGNQRWITVGVVLGLLLLVFALLAPAVQNAREEARISTSKNNLKQIGIALSAYHETHNCLPPGGTIRDDGVAMHGWLIQLMPFVDASPTFSQTDFDVPWNSPANLSVYESLIPYFLNPSEPASRTIDGYGLTDYLGNPNLFYRNSSVTFEQMENGIAHTWMVGEVAGNFQPWGYPFNWRALGTKLCDGPNSFGCLPWDGGHLLFADGSVSYFSDQTSPEILKRLADAPPLATKEQTMAPEKIFKTRE